MASSLDPARDLLFGLLALQNGLIDQGQLVAAFQAWTLNRDRDLADLLVERGDLPVSQRELLRALVEVHVDRHGGDVEKSLAVMSIGSSIREPWPSSVTRRSGRHSATPASRAVRPTATMTLTELPATPLAQRQARASGFAYCGHMPGEDSGRFSWRSTLS